MIDDDWAGGLVRSWEAWIDLPVQVGDALARHLLGAEPGEVVVGDATTVNLYKAASAAIAAGLVPGAVVTDDDNFPTDRYVLEGLAARHGLEYREVRSDPVDGPDADAIGRRSTALCCASRTWPTGRGALADMAGLTALAHEHGALALWDLSHSVGSVPVQLAAGADLAVAAPTSTSTAARAPRPSPTCAATCRELRQPIWGWFGQRDQFAMGAGYRPVDGIGSWLTGPPAVLGLACVDAGVALLADAGIERLRAKGMALTSLIVDLAGRVAHAPGVQPGQPPGGRAARIARGAGARRRLADLPGAHRRRRRRARLPGAGPAAARAARSPPASSTCGCARPAAAAGRARRPRAARPAAPAGH